MARKGVAALSFAVLLAVFEIGSCIKCYQCNSQSDPKCADPFGAHRHLVDCATQDSINYNREYLRNVLPHELVEGVVGSPRYCHKIVMQSGTTIRTCLDGNPNDPNYTCRLLDRNSKMVPSDVSKQIKHCSACDKEGCNGAGAMAVSLPLATLALVVSYLFCKQ